MKRIVLTAAIAALSTQAQASQWEISRGKWFACLDQAAVGGAMAAIKKNDHDAIIDIITRGRCLMLTQGTKVFVRFFAKRTAKITLKGVKPELWLPLEALRPRTNKNQ